MARTENYNIVKVTEEIVRLSSLITIYIPPSVLAVYPTLKRSETYFWKHKKITGTSYTSHNLCRGLYIHLKINLGGKEVREHKNIYWLAGGRYL